MMNNKKTGTDFEKEFCELLKKRGYWVHFIAPNKSGGQPFDVIAAKGGKAYAFDCKTCESEYFRIPRLEDNQIMSFERWLKCGNSMPLLAVKHNEVIYMVPYDKLKQSKAVKLEENNGIYRWK